MAVAPTSIHEVREPRRAPWVLVAILALLALGLAVALLFELDVFGSSSNSSGEGSGVAATETRDVAPFTSVELAGSNNVVVRVGEEQSVVVKADDNLLDRVTTDVQAGNLVIGNTPGDFTARSPMSVEIGVPSVSALTLTGSGNIVSSGIEAERLTVILSGSGTLIGSGTATSLDISVGGSGQVQFERLVAEDVTATVSGSGNIVVTATKSLDASVPGSGAIIYAGTPQDVSKSVTGSGAITPK